MRNLGLVLAVLSIVAASACKKDPPVEDPGDMGMGSGSGSGSGIKPPEDGVPAELIEAMEGEVAVFENLANVATAAGEDCHAMAAGLTSAAQEGQPALQKVASFGQDVLEENDAALRARFDTRINAAMEKLGKALVPCDGDPEVEGVLAKLGLG